MKQQKNTLTFVDSYWHSHTISKFADGNIQQAMKDLINILRYAGFSEKTIEKWLGETNLDF